MGRGELAEELKVLTSMPGTERSRVSQGSAAPSGRGEQGAAMDSKEITRLGSEIYENNLRQRLEKTGFGKYVVINVATLDYVVADTGVAARQEFDARFPGAPSYSVRVGIPLVA